MVMCLSSQTSTPKPIYVKTKSHSKVLKFKGTSELFTNDSLETTETEKHRINVKLNRKISSQKEEHDTDWHEWINIYFPIFIFYLSNASWWRSSSTLSPIFEGEKFVFVPLGCINLLLFIPSYYCASEESEGERIPPNNDVDYERKEETMAK